MTTAAYGYFAAHGGGRIAVVSSIAGTRGLGVAAAYSASKRFQNTYIDSLAQLARMQGSKIRFTDIRPGFVATEMAKGEGLFWVMPVDRVVEGIVRAIRRRRSVAVVTRRWQLPAWLIRHMPECIYRKMG